MKKILKAALSWALTAALMLTLLPAGARAAQYGGSCGAGLTWALDTDTYVLTINGTGEMTDYTFATYPKTPWYAYRNSIDKIVVGEGVTGIGNYAFCALWGARSAVLSSTLTRIGDRAFDGCSDLRTLSIPAAVSQIGQYAFLNCAKLSYAAVPEGVTKIEEGTFYGCSGLLTAGLPSSLTAVGAFAFANCAGLTDITVPSAVTSIGASAFSGCSGLLSACLPESLETVGLSAFLGCTGLLDVLYGGSSRQWGQISIETGNTSLTDAAISYNRIEAGGSRVLMTRAGKTYSLLTERQYFTEDSDEEITVTVRPDWKGHLPGRIILTQGEGRYTESETGVFGNLAPGKLFGPDGVIYLVLIDAYGKTVETTALSLRVTSSVQQDSDLLTSGIVSLIDDFTVEVPDSVPLIGGTGFGLSLGSISLEAETDADGFRAVLGADVAEWEKEDGKWDKQAFEWFKAGYKGAKDKILSGVEDYFSILSAMKAFGGKTADMTLSAGKKFTVSVSGYLEGYFDSKGKARLSEGGIIIAGKIGYTYKGLNVVLVFPIIYEVGVSGELEFVGGKKDLVPGGGLQKAFTGTLTPSASLEAGVATGLPYLLTGGVKGKLEAALEIALDRDYQKLTAEGGVKFQIKGPLDIVLDEWEIAKDTWYIYETGNPDTLLGKTGLFSLEQEGVFASLDLDAPVTVADTGSSGGSAWVGDESSLSAMDALETGQQLKVLQLGVRSETAPILCDMGGTKVMAWIADSEGRTALNSPTLVYSVYDAASDTWSAPAAVMDNGAPDFYPSMKDGYIVWQKFTAPFEDGASLNDISAASEIYAAKWNGAGFDTPVRLTDNASLDQRPLIAADGDAVSVVWTTNSENNFLGTTGTNAVMCRTASDGAFGEAAVLASGMGPIAGMDLAYIGGALTLACSVDTDGDLDTDADREIVTYQDGAASVLTNNAELDSNPVFAAAGGVTSLFWYGGGSIYRSDLASGAQLVFDGTGSTLSDDFTVVANGAGDMAALWTAVENGGAELHAALYDGAQWSDDVRVSDTGETVKYPSALLEDDGTLVVALNRTQKLPDGEGYYADGQSDLCTLTITPEYDLAVTGVYCDDASLSPGGDGEALISLRNNGERAVSGLSVSIHSVSGGVDASYTLQESLLPGEEKELALPFTLPAELINETVTVTVTPENGTEAHTEDNSAVFSIGRPDLAVTDIALYGALPVSRVSVTAENLGYTDASDVTASLRLDSDDGEIVDTVSLGTLVARTSVTFGFDADAFALAGENEARPLFVTLSTASVESATGNNSDSVLLENPGVSPFGSAVTASSLDGMAGIFTLNGVGQNDTDSDMTCLAAAAVYSADGKLIKLCMQSVTLPACRSVPIDFTIPTTEIQGGAEVRLILLDAGGGHKPLGTGGRAAIG